MKILLPLASLLLLAALPAFAAEPLVVDPAGHASFSLAPAEGGPAIFVDPVQESPVWKGEPLFILVTHIHADHLNAEVIAKLKGEKTPVVGPPTVIEKLGFGTVIENGGTMKIGEIELEAIPAYNTTPDRLAYHPKGRDNGYVVTWKGMRVYISGDTEDIPEMRALENIDLALLCMNLPYTMTVDQAASATLAFRPKVVVPYHYRGKEGMSDLGKFHSLVAADSGIIVREMKWY